MIVENIAYVYIHTFTPEFVVRYQHIPKIKGSTYASLSASKELLW